METCPKCAKPVDPAALTCAFCGVILAKARATARTGGAPDLTEAAPRNPAPRSRTTPDGVSPFSTRQSENQATSPTKAILKVAAAAGLATLAFLALNRPSATPDRQKGPDPTMETQPLALPAIASSPIEIPALAAVPNDQNGVTAEDVSFLNALSARLQGPAAAPPSADELKRLEAIAASQPQDFSLQDFLFAAWLRRADHDLRAFASVWVGPSLDRLKTLNPRRPEIYQIEAQNRALQRDWAGAVEAARVYDSLSGPPSLAMSLTLVSSLLNLNRREEARATLASPIFDSCETTPAPEDAIACVEVRRLRSATYPWPASEGAERQRAALKVDASKQQIQSDRFDVRFDGENQSGVARDVLFVLDRAYVRLADIYYERPSRKIQVVLHSAQDYYTATGAPFWSGGVFSSHNGAIQIPVRGLPSTLPKEMEDVLVHELSHAFVDEMSGGFAGRDTQEGLAQFMEGKRIEQELGAAELKRLARSGGQSVMSFYMLSLAVWQQIVQSRGQGTINELLKAMKTGGSEEAAFQKVFGQSGRAMRSDVLETFWRRYS